MDRQLLVYKAERLELHAKRLKRAAKKGNEDAAREEADHLFAETKEVCKGLFGQQYGEKKD